VAAPLTRSQKEDTMRIARWAVLATGSVWLLAAEAYATTVVRLGLEEMVGASAQIVVGTVSAAETVWVGRQIFTRYTVSVEETLLGDGRSTVSVLVPGGIDRTRRVPIGMAVAGAPALTNGERAVLLLAPIDHPAVRGDLQIVGFNQGRFPIVDGRVATTTITPGATRRTAAAEPLAALRTRLRGLVQQRGLARPTSASPQLRRFQ
jgi:hypothetical protein